MDKIPETSPYITPIKSFSVDSIVLRNDPRYFFIECKKKKVELEKRIYSSNKTTLLLLKGPPASGKSSLILDLDIKQDYIHLYFDCSLIDHGEDIWTQFNQIMRPETLKNEIKFSSGIDFLRFIEKCKSNLILI